MTKCTYCGEEEGTEKIANPNLDMNDDIDWGSDKSWWKVCKTCKEVIKLQTFHSIGCMHGEEKMVAYANKKLEELANKTKKPILCATIQKKEDGTYETASIEFTGEKDET